MIRKINIFSLFIIFTSLLIACKKEEFKKINEVIPQKIVNEITEHIPIYEGTTPPKIEGKYIFAPCRVFYSSFAPNVNDSLPDYSFTLSNQEKKTNNNFIKFIGDNQLLRIDSCENAYLVGTDKNFTLYYAAKGQHYSGINYKAALILSGTTTENGLTNCFLTIVLLSKTANASDSLIMPVNSFRIINDKDNIVEKQI